LHERFNEAVDSLPPEGRVKARLNAVALHVAVVSFDTASAGRKELAPRRAERHQALVLEPGHALPRGSLPISFAVVVRGRMPR
jgi:hypothetical protein